jgi:serine/threonine protein kinase
VTTEFWVGPLAAPDTYELVEMLGGGGEGEVWRATVPLSGQGRSRVAVKILPGTGAADEERRWAESGQLLRSLSHPGLVRVQDVFRGPAVHRRGEADADGTLSRYVVMDHVEGVTLREWVDENPDATAAARLRMLRTVASALDEMHQGASTEVPVAHGDVKPANVVVRDSGATVLVDLGLTRLVDAPGPVGRSTPYAAPELRGASPQATPEADRWAFAVTTAQVLTGEPPPVDGRGFLDAAALATQLRSHPVTRRRPILVRRILEVVAAPPEARPRALRVWLDGAADSLSQVTGPGPDEPPAADPPLAPPAGGRRRTAAPAGRPRRKWSLLVVLVGLAALLAGAGGVAWSQNLVPMAQTGAPDEPSPVGPPGADPLAAAPVGDFVGPVLGPSGQPTQGTAPTAPADSGGSIAGTTGSGVAQAPPAAPTSVVPAPRPAAVAAGGSAAVNAGGSAGGSAGPQGAASPAARAVPDASPARPAAEPDEPAPAKAPEAPARAAAQAEAPAVVGDGPRPYVIKGFGGNCLDVQGPSTADGTSVQMWDCNGASEMTWQVVGDEIHGFGGKCLDVRGPSTDDGTPVQMWDCNGAAEMKWQVVGAEIRGFGGKCLDVRGPSTADGTVVQMWDCNGATEQRWSLQRA